MIAIQYFSNDHNNRERRLRRRAQKDDLILIKSRRRDRRTPDFGKYWLHDMRNRVIVGDYDGARLDDIEHYLTS